MWQRVLKKLLRDFVCADENVNYNSVEKKSVMNVSVASINLAAL